MNKLLKKFVTLVLMLVLSLNALLIVGCEKDGGCKHEKTTTLNTATCTANGDLKELCTSCGKEVSSEPSKATGHSYVNGVCSSCGAKENGGVVANPGVVDEIIEGLYAECYTVSAESITVRLYTVTEADGKAPVTKDNDLIVLSNVRGQIANVGGKLFIDASAKISESDSYGKTDVDVKIYGDGEYGYITPVVTSGGKTESMIGRFSYDSLFNVIDNNVPSTNEPLLYPILGEELCQSIASFIEANYAAIQNAYNGAFNSLFTPTAVENGTKYTFNSAEIAKELEFIYTTTIDAVLEKYLGEGAIDSVFKFFEDRADKKLGAAFADLLEVTSDVIPSDLLVSLINKLASTAMGGEFDIEAILESENFKDVTLDEFVYGMTTHYDETGAMIENSGMTIEQIIAQATEIISSASLQDLMGDDFAYDLFSGAIDGLNFDLVLGNDGLVKNINLAFDGHSIKTGGSSISSTNTETGEKSVIVSTDYVYIDGEISLDFTQSFTPANESLKAEGDAFANGVKAAILKAFENSDEDKLFLDGDTHTHYDEGLDASFEYSHKEYIVCNEGELSVVFEIYEIIENEIGAKSEGDMIASYTVPFAEWQISDSTKCGDKTAVGIVYFITGYVPWSDGPAYSGGISFIIDNKEGIAIDSHEIHNCEWTKVRPSNFAAEKYPTEEEAKALGLNYYYTFLVCKDCSLGVGSGKSSI